MLDYLQRNKYKLVTTGVMAGGVYYYFREYIHLALSLVELGSQQPAGQPTSRSAAAQDRFRRIVESADQFDLQTGAPSQRTAELQLQLRDKAISDNSKKTLFREFVCTSTADSLSVMAVRIFARQLVRVAALLADEPTALANLLEQLTIDLNTNGALLTALNVRVTEFVTEEITDPTQEISRSQLIDFFTRIAAQVFSVSHRLVEPQPQDGQLHIAVLNAMIDPLWRANYAQRMLDSFLCIAEFSASVPTDKFAVAKVVSWAKAAEAKTQAAIWTVEYEENLFPHWSNGAGVDGVTDDADMIAMVEKLAKSM